MKLSLVVQTEGKAAGQIIPVNLAQFIIGRDPQCNLRPASALISKRHCALLVRNGEVFLRDFDSTNGTFLNEEPVKGEVPVKNDDLLRVGPLLFKVAVEATKVRSGKGNPTPVPASNKAAEPTAADPTATESAEPAGGNPADGNPADRNAPADKPAPSRKAGAEGVPPKKAFASNNADDDIADMLLSLGGEDSEEGSTSADAGVPGGSTVMDVMVPDDPLAQPGQERTETASMGTGGTPKPESKTDKKEEKKVDPAHMAAKAILDKYSRRGRT